MAKEFRDFSDEVVDSSSRIRKGLDGVVDSARGADSAHSDLSDVQKKATDIAKKFSDAQSLASTSITTSMKSTKAYTKGVGAMSGASKAAATNIGDLSDKVSGLNREVAGLSETMDGVGNMKIGLDVSEVEKGVRGLGGLKVPEINVKAKPVKIEVDTKSVEKAATTLEGLADTESIDIGVSVEVDGLADVTDLSKMLGRLPREKTVKVNLDNAAIIEGVREAAAAGVVEVEVEAPELESMLDRAMAISKIKPELELKSNVTEQIEATGKLIEMLEDLRARDAATMAIVLTDEEADKALAEFKNKYGDLGVEIDLQSNFDEQIENAKKMNDALVDLRTSILDIPIPPPFPEPPEIEDASAMIRKQVEESQELIEMLEGVRTEAGKAEFLRLNVEVAGLQAVESFLTTLDESQTEMFNARVEAVGFEAALGELGKSFPILQKRMERATKAGEELARTSSTLSNEIEKQGNALDDLVDKYNEGVREAESFLGGIGATEGALIGAGVAVAFLATKLVGLIGEFQSAALEVAEFATEVSSVGRQTFGEGSEEKIKAMRMEIGLTRIETEDFFDVLIAGSASGVASVDQMADAAGKLSNTFGMDVMPRLQEYVNLLEELPDIETDLEIGADFDDQAAALFALAQEGKVQTLIDLQAAGLAGGIAVEANKEEIGLLNTAAAVDVKLESIQEGLLKFYPQVGPPLVALSGGIAKGIALLAGGVATLAALKVFFGKGQVEIKKANQDTEMAVTRGSDDIVAEIRRMAGGAGDAAGTRESGRGGGRVKDTLKAGLMLKAVEKVFGKAVAKRGLGRAASRAAISIGGKVGGRTGAMAAGRLASGIGQVKGGDLKGIGRAAKGIGQLGKSAFSTSTVLTSVGKGLLTFAKSGAGVGLILGAAGLAVEKAAGMFGDVTQDTGAAMLKFQGKMLQAAGTIAGLAAIGQALVPIPGLGAAIGAIVGVVVSAPGVLTAGFDALAVGAKNAGNKMTQTFETVDGRQIQKYNEVIQGAGIVFQDFSGMMSSASDFVSDGLSDMGQSIKETAQGIGILARENKKLVMLIPGVGQAIGSIMAISDAVDSLKESIQGEGVAEEMAKVKAASESLDRSLSRLDGTTKRLNDTEAKEFKRVQEVAIALQRELGKTKATFSGIKFALADFEAELAAADLDIFQNVGGSVGGFNRSIDESSKAIRTKFGQVAKAVDRRRAGIITNAKLDAKARKNALDDLHKQEIAAVAEFAEGMSNLVGQLMNAPDILIAGFREAASAAEFEFIAEGGINIDEFLTGVNEGVKETNELFARGAEQQGKAIEELVMMQEDLKKKTSETAKALSKEYEGLGDAAKKAIGDAVNTEGGGVELVESNAGEAAERLNTEIEKAQEELDKLEDKINGFNVDRIQAAYNKASDEQAAATNNVRELTEQIDKLKEEQTKLVKKGKDSLEVSKKIAEAEKRKAEEQAVAKAAADKVLDEQEKFAERLSDAKVGQDKIAAAWKGITDRQGVANGELKGAKEAVDAAQQVTAENKAALEAYRKEVDGNLDGLIKAKNLIEPLAGVQSNIVQMEKKLGEIRENQVQLAQQQQKRVGDLRNAVETATMAQERALAAAEFQASTAALTGNAIDAMSDVYNNNVKLQREQVAAAQAAVGESLKIQKEFEKLAEGQRAEADKKRAAAEARAAEGDTAAADFLAKQAEALAKNAALTAANAKKAANLTVDLQKEAAAAQNAMLDAMTNIDDALSEFESTLSGRRIAAELDLGDALMELASFSDDFEKVTTNSFNVVLQTAKREAQLRRRAVEERIKDAKEAAEAEAQALEARGDVGGASQLREEMAATLQAKKRAELAKIETQEKKKVLQAAEAAADLARAAIDVEESLIDAEMDFLTEMGGNFESVLALQNQSVDLEREKLRLANEQVDRARAAGVTGVELRKLEVAAQIQGINVQKKAMGVQKGLFEELIAGAFGELDSSFGARRQRFSEVAMLGREGSRVRRGSGIRTGGETQTLAQREASRMLGSGRRDAAVGNILGAGGGVLGEMGPSKKTEEKIFDAASKNLEENIFTHDAKSGAKLDILADAIRALTGEDILNEDELNRTIAEADRGMETNGILSSLLEVGKGILDVMSAGSEGDDQSAVAKAQSDTANETAGVKDAVEKAADKSEKAASKTGDSGNAVSQALKEGTAAGVVTSQAVQQSVQEQKKSTVEQLGIARQDLKTSMAQLKAMKDSGKTEEFDKAAAETEAKLMRVVDLEKQVRVQESRNPIAGAQPQIAEIGRILSGGLPEQVQEFEGLVSAEKEVAGKAAETEEKRQDVTKTQENIAEGREPAPEVADADRFTGQSAKQVAEAARAGVKEGAGVAAKGGLTASGQRAFLGGVPATAQAQLDAGIGGVPDETREETIARLKRAVATDDGTITAASGMFQKEFDVTGGQLAVQTPETRKMEAEHRRDQLASLRGETPEGAAGVEPVSESAMSVASDVSKMPEKMKEAIERAKADREANISVAQSTPNMTAVPEETTTASRREEVTNRSQEIAGEASQASQAAFSSIAGAPGAASGVGLSSITMQVQGEMLVKFNNGYFKDTMATIVGEVINTPEVLKSIQDQGFLRK
jgi:hypothetical protein